MSTSIDAPVVLIAEDDADVRDLSAWKLEVAGYRTLHADNGRTALSPAHQHRPDGVVLDLGMPEMDGLTVCQQLQQGDATTHIPVLMLSGRVNDTDRPVRRRTVLTALRCAAASGAAAPRFRNR